MQSPQTYHPFLLSDEVHTQDLPSTSYPPTPPQKSISPEHNISSSSISLVSSTTAPQKQQKTSLKPVSRPQNISPRHQGLSFILLPLQTHCLHQQVFPYHATQVLLAIYNITSEIQMPADFFHCPTIFKPSPLPQNFSHLHNTIQPTPSSSSTKLCRWGSFFVCVWRPKNPTTQIHGNLLLSTSLLLLVLQHYLPQRTSMDRELILT